MYLLSLIFFLLGFIIILTKKISNNRGMVVDLSANYLYLFIGLAFIFLAIYIIYKGNRSKKIEEKFSKCPKCKETFTYVNLQKGKCPNCKEIDTIEIEEYYKKYPNEIDK